MGDTLVRIRRWACVASLGTVVILFGASSAASMMEDRQVAALIEMMRAVNAGDAAAYARLYAPEAVITIHGTGALEGRGAIEAHEVELLSQFPGARLAFYAVWQDGASAVVHYGVNGKTTGGAAMGHEGLLFYRFQPSGLIEAEQRYLDSLTPMAQLGLLGPAPARPLPTLPAGLRKHAATGSAQERENVSLVTASLAALDSRNEIAFLSDMARDAVVDEMIEANLPTGPSNVKAWFETWTGALPHARTEIVSSVAAGEFVLMETVVRGTLSGPLGRVSPSNTAIELHRALIVEIKDGRLGRITAFMNGKELAQAAGQWPLPAGTGRRP